MKMDMDISISCSVRSLLLDDEMHRLLKNLCFPKSEDREKHGIFVYLPLATKSINDYLRDRYDAINAIKKIPNYCFEQNDYRLLEELSKMGAISIKYTSFDENSDAVALITIKNEPALKTVYRWSEDVKNGHVLNYGWFSLHLLTGQAYIKDEQTKIGPKSGTFALFQGFLSEKNGYELATSEILHIQETHKYEHQHEPGFVEKPERRGVLEFIKDFRKKFGLNGQLRGLLIPTPNGYKLLPELD